MHFCIYLYCPEKMPSFYRKAIGEYEKRLARYARIRFREIRREKEWRDLLSHAESGWYLVPGESDSSEEFSRKLSAWERERRKEIFFFIGADEAEESGNERLEPFSLSCFRMNAPMTAMILFEQIYRGYRIMHNHPYHK